MALFTVIYTVTSLSTHESKGRGNGNRERAWRAGGQIRGAHLPARNGITLDIGSRDPTPTYGHARGIHEDLIGDWTHRQEEKERPPTSRCSRRRAYGATEVDVDFSCVASRSSHITGTQQKVWCTQWRHHGVDPRGPLLPEVAS